MANQEGSTLGVPKEQALPAYACCTCNRCGSATRAHDLLSKEEPKEEIPFQGRNELEREKNLGHSSKSPGLPVPHGLNPHLSTENPRNNGFSGSGAPIFGFGLADPAPKG